MMLITGDAATERKMVGIDVDVQRWRLRCRTNDIARVYLRYADRIEERTVLGVDGNTMTPGNLVSVNRWSVKAAQPKNFWRVEK